MAEDGSYEKFPLETLSVLVGVHELDADEPSQRRHYLKRAVVHENHDKHDIMLLELKTDIEFNKEVQPICVDASVFLPKTRCTVTGWGVTENFGQKLHAVVNALCHS